MSMMDGGSKLSQADANYRRGSPLQHCGVCNFYQGGGSCSKVESPISGYGISDIFSMQKNPFGSLIGPKEGTMINGMMQSGPDQSPHVAPPLQIGNRAY